MGVIRHADARATSDAIARGATSTGFPLPAAATRRRTPRPRLRRAPGIAARTGAAGAVRLPLAPGLTIRDLAQAVSPAGADAPLRGAALGRVDVVEDAYVLLPRRADRRRRAHARPRRARRRRRGAGRARPAARSRGSSTATRTPASPATAWRSSTCARRGASYEELHAAGGGILSTVRATRAAGEDALRAAHGAPPRPDARARHDDVGGQVGLRARPRHGAGAAPRGRATRAASRRGSARTRFRRSSTDADAYLDFALAEVLPEAADARRGRRRLPRAGRVRRRAGPPLPRGVPRARALRFGSTPTSSPRRAGVPLAVELGARSVDHLEATGRRRASPRSRRATSRPSCSRWPRSSLGRPMPPGRALVDAGAAVALATDFNPGSAFCESLPLVCSLACTQIGLTPGGGARRRAR